MNQRRRMIILLSLTLLLTACTSPGEQTTETADIEEIQANQTENMPEVGDELRIVSLSPSQTENLYALGLGEQLIGVSDFCDYPAEALQKEKLGSSWVINLERILELEPDLVFIYAGGQPEAVQKMTAMGIQVVNQTPEAVEEVFGSLLETGRLTGREEEATTLVRQLRSEMETIVSKVSGLPRVPVFYQIWDEPLQTAGPGSFIHELIELAGGENIAADADSAYPMYSVEALVEKNPEIFFLPPHVAAFEEMTEEMANAIRKEVRNRPGYDQIRAIQNNRIELMEPNIVSRPGVRIIQGLRLFAEAIHPEVF